MGTRNFEITDCYSNTRYLKMSSVGFKVTKVKTPERTESKTANLKKVQTKLRSE